MIMSSKSPSILTNLTTRLSSSELRPVLWTLWALPLIQCVSASLATPKPLSFLGTASILMFWVFWTLPLWWLSYSYSSLILKKVNVRGWKLWGCLGIASFLSFLTLDILGYFYFVNQVFNGWIVTFTPPFRVGEPETSTFFTRALFGALGNSAIWLAANFSSRLLLGRSMFDKDIAFTDRLPTFMHQVPANQRESLLAIKAQEHYIEIHTDAGSTLVLYRFGDALRELSGTLGKQVHRSFWVSANSIASYKRKNGKLVLTLVNGMQVPVSRSFVRDIEQSGFLPKTTS
jgi:hypothetical protein